MVTGRFRLLMGLFATVGLMIAGCKASPSVLVKPTPTVESLATPEFDVPAAGICADFAGSLVTVSLGMDTPSPRCVRVTPDQQLQVNNDTGQVLRVKLAGMEAKLAPGETFTFDENFGSFLAPGVHVLSVSTVQADGSTGEAFPAGGAEIWLVQSLTPNPGGGENATPVPGREETATPEPKSVEINPWEKIIDPALVSSVQWQAYTGQLAGIKGETCSFTLSYPADWYLSTNITPEHFYVQNVPVQPGGSQVEGDFAKFEIVQLKETSTGSAESGPPQEEYIVPIAGTQATLHVYFDSSGRSLRLNLTLSKNSAYYALAGYANLPSENPAAFDRYNAILKSMLASFQITSCLSGLADIDPPILASRPSPAVLESNPSGPIYETVFQIPVGEGGIQYSGADMPEIEIVGPNGLAVLPDGSFIVGDVYGNRLLRYDPSGKQLKAVDLYALDIINISDLVATPKELYLLEISFKTLPERYRVNRLTFEGELIAQYDIPKGYHLEDGLFGIAAGGEDQILLDIRGPARRFFQIFDPSNETLEELAGYPAYGRVYREDFPKSEGFPSLSTDDFKYTSRMTLGGMLSVLAANPDGSVYIVREDLVDDLPAGIGDLTIHYLAANGKQLGIARYPLAEWYFHLWRYIAVGPDGEVYALITREKTVDVLHLYFSQHLKALTPEAVEPNVTGAAQGSQITYDCTKVQRLAVDSPEAQQIVDEFVANYLKDFPTEYMTFENLWFVTRMGDYAVIQGAVTSEQRDAIAVKKTPRGYEMAAYYIVTVPERSLFAIPEYFVEQLPEAPPELFYCLDVSRYVEDLPDQELDLSREYDCSPVQQVSPDSSAGKAVIQVIMDFMTSNPAGVKTDLGKLYSIVMQEDYLFVQAGFEVGGRMEPTGLFVLQKSDLGYRVLNVYYGPTISRSSFLRKAYAELPSLPTELLVCADLDPFLSSGGWQYLQGLGSEASSTWLSSCS